MEKKLEKTLKDVRSSFEKYVQTKDERDKDACWKSIFNILGVVKETAEKQGKLDCEIEPVENSMRELERALNEGEFDRMLPLVENVEAEIRG